MDENDSMIYDSMESKKTQKESHDFSILCLLYLSNILEV